MNEIKCWKCGFPISKEDRDHYSEWGKGIIIEWYKGKKGYFHEHCITQWFKANKANQ